LLKKLLKKKIYFYNLYIYIILLYYIILFFFICRMLFASSKRSIRKALDGVQVEIQGTDYSEVDYGTVYEKATRNLRF